MAEEMRLEDRQCPLSATLGLIGEWWALVILHDPFDGSTRFDQFQHTWTLVEPAHQSDCVSVAGYSDDDLLCGSDRRHARPAAHNDRPDHPASTGGRLMTTPPEVRDDSRIGPFGFGGSRRQEMILGRLSSAALMLSGLAGALTPTSVTSSLDLTASSGRAKAETRAGLGGTYAALGAWALVSRRPAAHTAVGVVWLGAAAARIAALFVDDPHPDRTYWAYLAAELGFGSAAIISAMRRNDRHKTRGSTTPIQSVASASTSRTTPHTTGPSQTPTRG